MIKPVKYIFFVLVLAPFVVKGASTDTAAVFSRIAAGVDSLDHASYKYVLKATFPDGTTDELKGQAAMDAASPLLVNDCNAFLIIYTGHWIYKADHKKKELTIVDMDKQKDEKIKKDTRKQVLQQAITMFFADKKMMAAAHITSLTEEDGREKIRLGFPETYPVKYINIVLDKSTNRIVSYGMHVFKPWQKTVKGMTGTTEDIQCTNFSDTIDRSKYDITSYFTVSHGKAVLKKYNDYKLYSKI